MTASTACPAAAEFRVAASVVDVSPRKFPVVVNGGMTPRYATKIRTPVQARTIVMDDERERMAIVIVDSCMIPREIQADVKERVARRSDLRADRILIAATHTHSAPSAFGALGSDADLDYVTWLREQLVQTLVDTQERLQPARVGWTTVQAPDHTAVRRWILRSDRIADDPFGNPTVRASMHTAKKPENVTGPSGPEDPTLSILAFESLDGEPIAALCNFSMHYFAGQEPVSSDYFGLFCEGFQEQMRSTSQDADDFVAIMSHGCSGDIWRRDYFDPNPPEIMIDAYADGLQKRASAAWEEIEFEDAGELAMQQSVLSLRYRVPSKQRLQWAQSVVDALEGEPPTQRPEIYAREQLYLNELQSTRVTLQAMLIGDIAITSFPTETYALTGLKVKAQSPVKRNMVIELANGADGYIPPPEQHVLGGYNTWAARSAGLEVNAEPQMLASVISMLEELTGQTRRVSEFSQGPATTQRLDKEPAVYFRLNEMQGTTAIDASGHQRHGHFEPGVAFFLHGPQHHDYVLDDEVNRSVHFAGGRLLTQLDCEGQPFSACLSLWCGMPNEARDVTGWFLSHDHAWSTSSKGLHLGIAGTGSDDDVNSDKNAGKLMLQLGSDDRRYYGGTRITRWQWHDVALVHSRRDLKIYLDGKLEIEVNRPVLLSRGVTNWFLGGRSDNNDSWEGRLDEISIFQSVLESDTIQQWHSRGPGSSDFALPR